jgi:hypothetical protein
MIPQLTTTSPMRKSRIAMMVFMELASWTATTTQEKEARALGRWSKKKWKMDTDSGRRLGRTHALAD